MTHKTHILYLTITALSFLLTTYIFYINRTLQGYVRAFDDATAAAILCQGNLHLCTTTLKEEQTRFNPQP